MNSKNYRITFFLLVFSYLCTYGQTPTPQSCLIALSKAAHTLSIVDPISLKVIAKIPVGEDPHEVIASPDGKYAYVTIYGGGRFHEIDVLDLIAQKSKKIVDTRPLFGPHGIDYKNGKVWFSAEGSKAIGTFDAMKGLIDWSMGTGQDRTHMIYATADAKSIYTINISSGTVSIFNDTLIKLGPPPPPPPGAPGTAVPNNPPGNFTLPPPRKDWIQTLVPVSRGSEGFDVTPDGNYLWTVSGEDGRISIVDLKAKKLLTKIDAKVLGANRLKFTLDGKYAVISSLRIGNAFVFDVATMKEIQQIPIGKGAAGIEMDPNGKRVFVACTPDNYVAVIDLKSWTVTDHIDVGPNPDGLAWAKQNN